MAKEAVNVAPPIEANLIRNGSFENFASNSAKFSGWTGLQTLEGWTLEGAYNKGYNWFEMHANGYSGVKSADGTAMLDMGTSPGNVTISQQIDGLSTGAKYQLKFSIANAGGDNALSISLGGVDLGVFKASGKTMETFTINVEARLAAEKLVIKEIGKADNTGTYLDAVSFVKLAPSAAELEAAERAAAEKLAAEQAIAEKAAAEKLAAEKAAAQAAAELAAAEKAAAEKAAADKLAAELAAAEEQTRVVEGTKENDEVYVAKGVDKISTGEGNDFIISSVNGAEVDGGAGFDTLSYLDQGGEKGIFVDLEKGYATNTFGNADKVSGIEMVLGSWFDDEMHAASTGSSLDGKDGHDAIEGRGGKDVILGGGGNDKLFGGTEEGEARNGQGDTLVGGHGDDFIDGGSDGYNVVDYSLDGGTRAISVNLASQSVEDSWGTIDTVVNIGIIKGTDKGDHMQGGEADIIFVGNGGDDMLIGGSGANELYGGDGNDTIVAGDRSTYMEGGNGDDALVAGAGFNAFGYYKNSGADVIHGFKETDVLRLYYNDQTAEELLTQTSYHIDANGVDGIIFKYGDASAFLAGVYELKASNLWLYAEG